MNKRKLPFLLITAIITACSSNVNPVITTNKTSDYTANNSKISLTANEIKQFEREYSFTTKSFSQAYLDKKLNLWLNTTNNEKLLRELKFAQLKHPDLAHAFFDANTAKYTSMIGKTEVISQMDNDNPFAVFMRRALAGNVTTFAGNGAPGSTDGTGTSAQFNSARVLTVDSTGNVYVAEGTNHRIRKITSAGVVSTFAGSGTYGFADGTGTDAQFAYPYGVSVDSLGNVFVADQENHKIRKITTAGVVSTFAGSGLIYPSAIAVAPVSGNVYVGDVGNNTISKITSAGVLTTLASSVRGWGLAVDSSENVYVADSDNNKIRKITTSGVVTTLAGSSAGFADDTGTLAQFSNPYTVAVDSSGNVYVADVGNHKIRKVTSSGVVTTLAGSDVAHSPGFADGNGTNAIFNNPSGIAVDSAGKVYVADQGNNRIRKIQ